MYGADRQDRWKGAGAAALLVAGIGYGLVAGLDLRFPRAVADELTVVALLPEAPPPRPDPIPARRQAEKRNAGAASPPDLTAQATPIVAPVAVIRPPVPPPVVVAPVAGVGGDPSQGTAPVAGPGTGSGGVGDGTGSGDGGDGDGGGGGVEIDAELVSSRLRYRDLPRELYDAVATGVVTYRVDIGTDGRLTGCRVTRSSGNRALDAATCALALRQTRFRPARDAAGRKVPDRAIFEQTWTAARRAEE